MSSQSPREEHLATLSRDLNEAETTAEVAAAVSRLVPIVLDCDGATIAIYHSETATVGVVNNDGGQRDIDTFSYPFTEIAPLVGSHTEPIGVLLLGWEAQRPGAAPPLTDDRLKQLVELISAAATRTERTQQRQTLISSIQSAMLTTPPARDRMQLCVQYAPAAETLGFGGDWYDVVTISDTRTALVVGDVVGHDPTAAGQMTKVRTMLSTLVELDMDLLALFDNADSVISSRAPNTLASAAVVTVDTSQRTLTSVLAGHPPPLLRSPGGQVSIIEHRLRPLLGVAGTCKPPVPQRYEPGSVLLMYTDGLIERRSSDLMDDIAQLAEFFSTIATDDCELLATTVMERGGRAQGHDDDIAIVVAVLE